VGRTPRSAADAPVGLRNMGQADFVGEKRSRGTRADEGVRPTYQCQFFTLGQASARESLKPWQ
jgi:hypothetical protein